MDQEYTDRVKRALVCALAQRWHTGDLTKSERRILLALKEDPSVQEYVRDVASEMRHRARTNQPTNIATHRSN